jgi:CheY-specific phosphatase CheX
VTDLAVAEWQQAAVDVVSSIGTDVLAFESCSQPSIVGEVGLESQGAYVPILSGDHSLHVGVVSSEDGCHVLTRALLGMAPDEEVSADDVHDAVGEIANMVAGGVKTKVVSRGVDAQLGLPIFIHGHIAQTSVSQSLVSQIEFGGICVRVTVVKTARGTSRAAAANVPHHNADAAQ